MQSTTALKKVLKPVHLWALAVGLVISGEYFGWNLGWKFSGTMGLLLATLVVSVLYITFIFSFTELSAAIPHAGGPFAYAYTAFGPSGGFIAGYATLVEFLFAPPAIAVALGSYMHFLNPQFNDKIIAYASYAIFTLINLGGIKESAIFNLLVTALAVIELCLFIGITGPHFSSANFMHNALPNGFAGVFSALPYAVWLYLGIEGVAMVAEEVVNPQKDFKKGYLYGIATLVILALGVMLCAGGAGNWETIADSNNPLPDAISMALGSNNRLTNFFAGIGLFGLIASFHSLLVSSSRQIFALSRSGYLPSFLSTVNSRFKTPHWPLIVSAIIGVLAIYTGTTDAIIILSVIGAVVMYIISMVSIFALRIKQPHLHRPFKVPFYPIFPLLALLLSLLCLVAIAWYNATLTLCFFIVMVILMVVFNFSKRAKVNVTDAL